MNYVFVFALGIGFAAGLRSLTPPAVVAWAAHLGWLNLSQSPFGFMGSFLISTGGNPPNSANSLDSAVRFSSFWTGMFPLAYRLQIGRDAAQARHDVVEASRGFA